MITIFMSSKAQQKSWMDKGALINNADVQW